MLEEFLDDRAYIERTGIAGGGDHRVHANNFEQLLAKN
jgi:hypothetical protein